MYSPAEVQTLIVNIFGSSKLVNTNKQLRFAQFLAILANILLWNMGTQPQKRFFLNGAVIIITSVFF